MIPKYVFVLAVYSVAMSLRKEITSLILSTGNNLFRCFIFLLVEPLNILSWLTNLLGLKFLRLDLLKLSRLMSSLHLQWCVYLLNGLFCAWRMIKWTSISSTTAWFWNMQAWSFCFCWLKIFCASLSSTKTMLKLLLRDWRVLRLKSATKGIRLHLN